MVLVQIPHTMKQRRYSLAAERLQFGDKPAPDIRQSGTENAGGELFWET